MPDDDCIQVAHRQAYRHGGRGTGCGVEGVMCDPSTASLQHWRFPGAPPGQYGQVRHVGQPPCQKMIILQFETAEHREPGTSAPQGEPGPPPSVLTPQSPCTTTRAVGVGTLYQDTIYAAAARTNVTPALLHRTGGVINPVGPEAHPCAGAPPPSTEPC